jgi:lysophospholipase L1-like esterase
LLAVFLTVCQAQDIGSAAKPVPLKKGERIVFLGDSITQGGGGPKGYVTLVKNAIPENHKDLNIEVINAGVSGNRVADLTNRLQQDVLDKKPTLVVIYIGINDAWRGTTPKDAYSRDLTDVVNKIKETGARVILCTPSVIGEKTYGTNPRDEALRGYCELSRQVARETGVQLLDLRKAFTDYLKTHNPENKERDVLTVDGVHLNEAGNKFVAKQMLSPLGVRNGS